MNMTEVDELRAQRQQAIASVLSAGLSMLSSRILTVLALLLDAGIFCWAMNTESWVRLAGAVAFSIASWCVIHLRPQGAAQ